jgi:hypothetical protein
VVRGATELLPVLSRAFSGLTVLETSSFLKTMMRQRVVMEDGHVNWRSAPTAVGAPLDDLYAENQAIIHNRLIDLIRPSSGVMGAALA